MKYPIMCQTDIDYLARKERYKDLLREAEHERLIQSIRAKQPGNQRWHRRVAIWIRTRMEEYHSKLQGYDPVPPPNVVSTGMTDPEHSQN
jgi:hypothetical protein